MSIDEIKKKFDECDGIYSFMYGLITFGDSRIKMPISWYDKYKKINIINYGFNVFDNRGAVVVLNGCYASDFWLCYLDDYGRTWAFTKEELNS